MKHWWNWYEQKMNALSKRERVLVICAAFAVVSYALFALVVNPPQRRQRTLLSQMEQQREEMVTLQAQRETLTRSAKNPQAAAVARRTSVLKRIEETDEALKTMHKELVPAQRVNLLLQDMLKGDRGPQLVSLRTLAVAPLLPEAQKSAAPPRARSDVASVREFSPANVYKHGVELTLRGSFEELYDYVARLERTEWRMYWSRARVVAESYPRLSMTLTIYTLSLDKAWLEV